MAERQRAQVHAHPLRVEDLQQAPRPCNRSISSSMIALGARSMTSPILASPPNNVSQVYSQASKMAQRSVWDCLGQAVSLGVPGTTPPSSAYSRNLRLWRMPVESQRLLELLSPHQPGNGQRRPVSCRAKPRQPEHEDTDQPCPSRRGCVLAAMSGRFATELALGRCRPCTPLPPGFPCR